jgi:hypothetical protein
MMPTGQVLTSHHVTITIHGMFADIALGSMRNTMPLADGEYPNLPSIIKYGDRLNTEDVPLSVNLNPDYVGQICTAARKAAGKTATVAFRMNGLGSVPFRVNTQSETATFSGIIMPVRIPR